MKQAMLGWVPQTMHYQKQFYSTVGPSYLKSRGAIELGGMDCLWKHISDIGDEFF